MEEQIKTGFFAVVGRPNTGKSSLINAIVEKKISIVTNKPSTTRKAIQGIKTKDDYQLVFTDTPGLIKPNNLLTTKTNSVVHDSLKEVDVVLFCLPANQIVGTGDRFIYNLIPSGVKVIIVLTKIDLLPKPAIANKLVQVANEFSDNNEIVRFSALEKTDILEQVLIKHCTLGPKFFENSNEQKQEIVDVSEIVRQETIKLLDKELPHSVFVQIAQKDIENKTYFVNLFVERQSQKGIILGKQGCKISKIRTRAKREINKALGEVWELKLFVKIAKDWQQDPKKLAEFGFF